MKPLSLLWLGFGDIARRCSPYLQESGMALHALCRRDIAQPELASMTLGDAADTHAVSAALDCDPDAIVMSLTPKERSAAGYEQSYLQSCETLLRGLQQKNLQPKLIIFVSSTSVYHQDSGERVDEDSHCEPKRETARVILRAEELLRRSGFPSTSLRFSGIYGPGRYHLVHQVARGTLSRKGWSNRIHSEDAARVIAFLLQRLASGETNPEIKLASDTQPAAMAEVAQWIALRIPGCVKYDWSNLQSTKGRRCDSRQLQALGFQFLHPDFKSGFPEVIKAYLKQVQQDQ